MPKISPKIIFFILIMLLFAPFSLIASENGFIDQLMPDNPFYFIKVFKERISLILTLDPQKKAEKALKYSKEKLQEAEKMSNFNNKKALRKALGLYQYYINLINDLGVTKNINIANLKQTIDKYSNNNESVKALYEKLPPPNKTTLKEFLNRGITAFKKIFIFLIELIFKIKNFFQGIIKQFS